MIIDHPQVLEYDQPQVEYDQQVVEYDPPPDVTRATPLMVNAPTWNTGNPPWTVPLSLAAGFPRPWTQRLRHG